MNRTTAHNRFFRLIYNSPKQSNIFAGINVSVYISPAVIAFENFVIPIANMQTIGAGFRCICWFYNNQINSRHFAFVGQKHSQLGKRPSSKFASEKLITPFRCKPNVSQILYGDSVTIYQLGQGKK